MNCKIIKNHKKVDKIAVFMKKRNQWYINLIDYIRNSVYNILYQVASATASPRYMFPLLFSKKVAVFEYLLYC